MPGTTISIVDVTQIHRQGFVLSLDGEALPVSFDDFPWFAGAAKEQLADVRWPAPDHLYWPQLDIDLSVASIRDPAAFPLKARSK